LEKFCNLAAKAPGVTVMNKSNERWMTAQQYEKNHWRDLARRILDGSGDLRWYKWKADRTLSDLDACGLDLKDGAVAVEIGSGPVGQIGFIPTARKIAVDPLAQYFAQFEALITERPENVEYINSKGEVLPFQDALCDLVIIDNCLDHCEDPGRVLAEIKRILKPSGCLYLTLNVRHFLGRMVRDATELILHLDKGHPYSYHLKDLQRQIKKSGFEEMRGWMQTWGQSMKEEWTRRRSLALLKMGSLTLERLYRGVWIASK
jgi:SAM-dependent methyltransferase